ncbi:threonine/serine dehydratase [Marinilongibacter aquaticus]|uniref:threonine ammonia-lyase n=1 Tax=Marinilongibacter aquaticus TaxID=2975157 RepID=UPI0021BDB496|nr:threonine/serine dehydratase [Marinilongibacter aquaticus]UBM60412.1 threonine/serine dehydratase [Marinilongibacter aquaticus]
MQTPSREEIISSHERIKPFIKETPLLHSEALDRILNCEIWVKCENEQVARAFKSRGAFNAVLQLKEAQLANGLVTHSSGNHAQSLAYAGKILGAKTYVVMPETAPQVKIEKVKALNAEISFCKNNPEARQAAADEIVARTGATFIHPFDNHNVICGQATVAKEIISKQPDLDVLIPPVGGGGLLSGTGLSAKYFASGLDVIAAEPEGALDAIKSFRTGQVEKADYVNTLADGLQTYLSPRTLHIIRDTVKDIRMAKESSIPLAMKMIHTHFGIWVEPSSAVTLAMLIDQKEEFEGKKLALILTGGNISTERAEEITSSVS